MSVLAAFDDNSPPIRPAAVPKGQDGKPSYATNGRAPMPWGGFSDLMAGLSPGSDRAHAGVGLSNTAERYTMGVYEDIARALNARGRKQTKRLDVFGATLREWQAPWRAPLVGGTSLAQGGDGVVAQTAADEDAAQVAALLAALAAEQRRDPKFMPNLLGPEAIKAEVTRRRHRDLEAAAARVPASVAGEAGAFIGEIGASFSDPAVIFTLPAGAGPSGARTLLGRVLATAGREAAVQAGVATAMQPLLVADAAAYGFDYGVDDALLNIAGAAILGAGFGGGSELARAAAPYVTKPLGQAWARGRGALARALDRARAPDIAPAAADIGAGRANAGDMAQTGAGAAGASDGPEIAPAAVAATDASGAATPLTGTIDAMTDAQARLDAEITAEVAAQIAELSPLLRNPAGDDEHAARFDATADALAHGEDAPPLGTPSAPINPAPALPSATAVGGDGAFQNGQIYRINADQLQTDAARFQYKSDGDGQGVTSQLRGDPDWNDDAAGVVMVWQDSAGTLFVVDGHQRSGLARRLMAAGRAANIGILAKVYREVDGVAAADAFMMATAANLARDVAARDAGKVIIDGAKIMRRAGRDAVAQLGVDVTSQIGRQMQGLTALSDEGFGLVINEIVDAGHAAVVGRIAADRPELHVALLMAIRDADLRTAGQVEMMTRDMLAQPVARDTQMGLFGAEELVRGVYAERAKVLDATLRMIRTAKRALSSAADNVATLEQAGGGVDVGRARTLAERNAQLAAMVERVARMTDNPINKALTDAALAVANGESVDAAARRFLDASFSDATLLERILTGEIGGTGAGGSERGAGSGYDGAAEQGGAGGSADAGGGDIEPAGPGLFDTGADAGIIAGDAATGTDAGNVAPINTPPITQGAAAGVAPGAHISEQITAALLGAGWKQTPNPDGGQVFQLLVKGMAEAGSLSNGDRMVTLEMDDTGRWLTLIDGFDATKDVDLRRFPDDPAGAITALTGDLPGVPAAANPLDLGAQVDPALAGRQQQQMQLRADSPMRGGAAQVLGHDSAPLWEATSHEDLFGPETVDAATAKVEAAAPLLAGFERPDAPAAVAQADGLAHDLLAAEAAVQAGPADGEPPADLEDAILAMGLDDYIAYLNALKPPPPRNKSAITSRSVQIQHQMNTRGVAEMRAVLVAMNKLPGGQVAEPSPPPLRQDGFAGDAVPMAAVVGDDTRTLTGHPDYRAAKGGDLAAGERLVLGLIPQERLQQLASQFAGARFVPVWKGKETSNAGPLMLATELAVRGGGAVEKEIVQRTMPPRTGKGLWERMINRPVFDGEVVAGGRYVLVDDVVTLGGTLAELAEHIRRGGGIVDGVVAMVDHTEGFGLTANAADLARIEQKGLGDVIRAETGIEPSALTGVEANRIASVKSRDALRRFLAKGRAESGRGAGGTDGANASGGRGGASEELTGAPPVAQTEAEFQAAQAAIDAAQACLK